MWVFFNEIYLQWSLIVTNSIIDVGIGKIFTQTSKKFSLDIVIVRIYCTYLSKEWVY